MEKPAPVITIRRCTIDDAPALGTLARRTFHDTFIDTCTAADMQHFLETSISDARISGELKDAEDYSYFAEVDGIPIAFIRFLEEPVPFSCNDCSKPLSLSRLYVDAPYKGQGIAHALMDYYIERARGNRYDYLWLGVWEHNYRAQSFYRRYGFRFTGYTHPFPIGNTPQTDEWWAMKI